MSTEYKRFTEAGFSETVTFKSCQASGDLIQKKTNENANGCHAALQQKNEKIKVNEITIIIIIIIIIII